MINALYQNGILKITSSNSLPKLSEYTIETIKINEKIITTYKLDKLVKQIKDVNNFYYWYDATPIAMAAYPIENIVQDGNEEIIEE